MKNADSQPQARQTSRRCGYTLVELLVGMVASTLLLVGMASAIAITARAVSPPSGQMAVLKAAEASSLMADEVQSAIHISSHSDSAVEFILADRDGDESFEKIQYAWDAATQMLSRQHGLFSGPLLSNVTSFGIYPSFRSVSETLGGVVSESSQTAFGSVTSAGDQGTWSVSPYSPCGQSVRVSHADDVVLWSIDEVSLLVKRSSYITLGEQINVQIREATGDGLPTSHVLAEGSISLSSLSSSQFQWKTVTLTGAERLLPTQNVCIVVTADYDVFGTGGRVAYAKNGYSDPGSMLKFSFFNWSWRHDYDDVLFYTLKGTRHSADNSTHEVVRQYIAGYDIQMEYGGDTNSVRRRIRLLNTPENVSGIWRLDFNSDALSVIDVNFDGTPDWVYTGDGTFHQTSLNSILTLADGQSFQSSTDNDFSAVTTVDLHCRGANHAVAGGGAFLEIPFGVDASPHGQLSVSVGRTAQGTQTAQVVAADDGAGQVIALIKNLPNEIVDIRIVIDAKANQVAVWVNDEFQGRSAVTQPLSNGLKRVQFGALGAAAEFDFLSIRAGAE